MAKLVKHFEWRFLGPRFWGVWAGLILLWLVSFLPRSLYHFIAGQVGLLAMRLNHKRRRIAEINLSLCFPDMEEAERARLLHDNFRLAGICLFDLGVIWLRGRSRLEKVTRIEGAEHYHAAREAGKQVILLTGHTLALDHGATALAINYARHGTRAVSMYKPQSNDLLAWLMFRTRTQYGVKIYAREEGLRPIIKDIKQGSVFYYLPDEDLGPDDSIFVPLFGVEKATVPALGSLARLTNAAVLPCVSQYIEEEARYLVRIMPALEDYPSGDKVTDAVQMNEALEQLILQDRKQYMWVYKLFKTRPKGEEGIY